MSVYRLTPEKENFVQQHGHVIAMGGPGSGKTTAALLKAQDIIKNNCLKKGQSILFLSFARATIARVIESTKQLDLGHDLKESISIKTYHSFFWDILYSSGYLLNGIRPTQILSPHEAAALMAGIDGKEERKKFQEKYFSETGALHFDLFAQKCAEILGRSDSIRWIICKKYPYIIVDEFQDTNESEWKVVQLLSRGSEIIALADPDQRIYEFRGANPKRISEYISYLKPSLFDFAVENYRNNGTDILSFGNDLLRNKKICKDYEAVKVMKYPIRKGEILHLSVKIEVLQAIRRLNDSIGNGWSLAILVPTNRLMVSVSDYLSRSQSVNGRKVPTISHYVAIETSGPALSAILIARLLDKDCLTGDGKQIIKALLDHIKGRQGENKISRQNLELAEALENYIVTSRIRGEKRQGIVDFCREIENSVRSLVYSGNPIDDWLKARSLLKDTKFDVVDKVYEDSIYLRLLRKGSLLQSGLSGTWRKNGSYIGCETQIQAALLQDSFALSNQPATGINVMTIHKAKGKEFDEVIIYEGVYQDRFLKEPTTEYSITQAILALRVAVTRARRQVVILTPDTLSCQLFENH